MKVLFDLVSATCAVLCAAGSLHAFSHNRFAWGLLFVFFCVGNIAMVVVT